MNTSTFKPIEQNQRTPIIDILRGWALFGVVLVNYSIFFSFRNNVRVPDSDVVSKIAKLIVQVIFTTKCWTLLSLLFGYGFSALITNLQSKGSKVFSFFSQRMFWLFIIACINCCFYYGDVLKDYALMGMILLPFYRISSRSSLYISIGLFLVIPAMIPYVYGLNFNVPFPEPDLKLFQSHDIFNVFWFGIQEGIRVVLSAPKLFDWNIVMIAYAFLGQFLYKTNFFRNLPENKNKIKRVFWWALAFTFLLATIHILYTQLNFNVEKYYDMKHWFMLGQMVIITCTLCWLYLAGKLKRFFKSMQIIGKMTLTNYISQNLIGLLLFSGFGLGLLHMLPYSYHILFAIIIFVAQVYFSKWWLSKYNYGPVEWIWRELTYKRKLILKHSAP